MSGSRKPSEARTPRMERLARLPVFFGLQGRRVVVAGGSAAAAWKAELLSAAGARVAVFAPAPSPEMRELAADPPDGTVALVQRFWQIADLDGAVLAVGAFDKDEDAAAFATAARARGVPVNVVDKPAFCDFAFGAIVNRSPLVIGISTDGAAPVFAKAIRAKLEALIPRGFAGWAQAAQRWRARLQASGLSFARRRRFWELFTTRALATAERLPSESDYRTALSESAGDATAEQGSVILLGAGPGDPELLTLRAVRALQSADVILVDDLVAPEVLDFARREAKKICVGKRGHGASCSQAEINALMISAARSGKRVVRLKGGDPLIFGRAGEEMAACRAAGIAVEVVPGISAAQGAAARLGVSLTHRRHARRVQYVTGHGEDGALPRDFDWRSVVDPATTTAVYMPAKTIAAFMQRAIAAGLDPATPAAAIACATRNDEMKVVTTAADLPARLPQEPQHGPVLVLIGRVLADAADASSAERLSAA